MGIHGCPTCVMNFDGATGWLVGEPHQGLKAMFAMMNAERIAVGIHGLALSEASYQAAVAYARERRQGRAPGGPRDASLPADPIIVHPDVRRMLMTQRALTEGCRMLALWAAQALDVSERHPEPSARASADALVALLTPVVKAFLTDCGSEVANLGVQVLGGHGFIRANGQEQYARDVRITPIYEGTNGIQAIDLAGRKLSMDGGAAMRAMLAEIRGHAEELARINDSSFGYLGVVLDQGADALESATDYMLAEMSTNRDKALAAATTYLKLAGDVVGGYLLCRSAHAARDSKDDTSSLVLASFFAGDTLVRAAGTARALSEGAEAVHASAGSLWD
jgi:butyryl-CoA dehydrogenase